MIEYDDTDDLREAGYELTKCSWDEKTGTNTLTFEREIAGVTETETVGVQQPTSPKHAGLGCSCCPCHALA